MSRLDPILASCKVLEYLIKNKEHGKEWTTTHDIALKAFDNTQKDSKILDLIKLMVQTGYIQSMQLENNRSIYAITEKGVQFYKQVAKEFYNGFSLLMKKYYDDEKV